VVTVYCIGLFQGLALVAFPAASNVLTSSSGYDLSSTQYGLLFVPQVAMAIAGSLAMPGLSRRFGVKPLLLVGVAADLLSMVLLAMSATVAGDAIAFAVLLTSTALLGLGFGVTLSCLSTIAAGFRPDRPEVALTTLNVLLGLGTALSPLLIALFTNVGEWWGLPVAAAVGLAVLLVLTLTLPLEGATPYATNDRAPVPRVFWAFAAALVAYGICETMFGNWGTTVLRDDGASSTTASYALAAFWACVTLGRLLISFTPRQVPTLVIYRVLPWAIAVTLLLVATVADGTNGVVIFAAGGFACSGFFPMTIGYSEATFPALGAVSAGWLIAAYQVGYGIAAFGAGALESTVGLTTVFAASVAVAAAMGVLAIGIGRAEQHAAIRTAVA
jgi:MFS family permease